MCIGQYPKAERYFLYREAQVSTISPEQIRTDLLQILSKLADLNPSQIKDSDRLREDLGLDSLQSMELLSRISDKYELNIEIEDVMDLQTVAEVVNELATLVAGAG
jgi:acyl carrier protein